MNYLCRNFNESPIAGLNISKFQNEMKLGFHGNMAWEGAIFYFSRKLCRRKTQEVLKKNLSAFFEVHSKQ